MDPGLTADKRRQSGAKVRLRREALLSLPPPALNRRPRDAEGERRFVERQMLDTLKSVERDDSMRTPKPLALRLGPRQPGPNALDDTPLFEVGQWAIWSLPAGVVASMPSAGQADERDAERQEVVEQRDQVSQVTPEPIGSPADQDVEPSTPRVAEYSVERGVTFLRPAHYSTTDQPRAST
jgi:hypothetical protein